MCSLKQCHHDNARNEIARSKKKKLFLLLLMLMNSQIIDVLAINETKLDSTIRDTDVYLTGFEIIRLGAGNKWQKWCWWANTIFILGFMLYKWSIHLSHRPFIYVRVSKYSTGFSICEWMNLLQEFNSVFIESGMSGL